LSRFGAGALLRPLFFWGECLLAKSGTWRGSFFGGGLFVPFLFARNIFGEAEFWGKNGEKAGIPRLI
jgi:hypothetical protein